MAEWRNLAKALALADGVIGEREALLIRDQLLADRSIDRAELEFLLEVRHAARSVVPSFTQFVNEVVKKTVLKDGTISSAEAVWLGKWIRADRKISPDERKLLEELRRDARQVCPEFQALCEACLNS